MCTVRTIGAACIVSCPSPLVQKEVPASLSLKAISGPCEGTTHEKTGTVLTVGRTRARDIHIRDSAVSEKHAELRWENSRWTVTDVGSSNGTVLNGKKLCEGEHL